MPSSRLKLADLVMRMSFPSIWILLSASVGKPASSSTLRISPKSGRDTRFTCASKSKTRNNTVTLCDICDHWVLKL